MPPSPQAQTLNQKSLFAFKSIFAALPAPQVVNLSGVYRAEFTGPGWLRRVAPPGLGLLGLGGWKGKEFSGDGRGLNLVRRRGELLRIFPVRLLLADSSIDGKACLAVHYAPECPFPWPYVFDELRQLDETCLLGLTITHLGLLRKLALPFLLHAQEKPHGL
ncbi:MAG: hypothetical protein AB1894_13445 [Chloroflexota bacterium]